jgi:RNA polymerase sigma factor (sigma-70 family)
MVFTIAMREGLSAEDAADVTQTTFEALLAQLGMIEDPGQISYWLMTVARRQAWRVRDDRRRQLPDGATAALERPDGTDPPAELGTRLWLYDGLQALDETCRHLIISLYLDPRGPSYSELASQLGRPVGSIGPTRARCLGRLREILEDRL